MKNLKPQAKGRFLAPLGMTGGRVGMTARTPSFPRTRESKRGRFQTCPYVPPLSWRTFPPQAGEPEVMHSTRRRRFLALPGMTVCALRNDRRAGFTRRPVYAVRSRVDCCKLLETTSKHPFGSLIWRQTPPVLPSSTSPTILPLHGWLWALPCKA